MNKFLDALIFSFFIAISMVMLDALYHLATDTAVHINYVLVKMTLIFLILFLITFWSGKGKDEGIFTCISGPVIFYIYYLFADPTLNRAIFKIDEGFGYIFLHIFAFAIVYSCMYILIFKEASREIRSALLAFIMTLTVFGLDSFYRLGKVQLISNNEELVAKVMGFSESLYLVMFLLVFYFLIFYYIKNQKIKILSYLIITLFGVYFIGQDISRAIFGFINIIPLMLMTYYINNNIEKDEYKQRNNKFLIFAIIFTLVGTIYTFLNYKTVKLIGFGLRHNDHVMIGVIALTIAVAAFYRFLKK